MKIESVKKTASYFDPFETDVAKRSKTAEKEVSLSLPESNDEALAFLSSEPANLVKAACLLARANAEADLDSAIPQNAITSGMLSAMDKAFRSMPQFSGLKSKERKTAIGNWIADSGTAQVMVEAFRHLRGVTNNEDEE